jgi:hypothetical protein
MNLFSCRSRRHADNKGRPAVQLTILLILLLPGCERSHKQAVTASTNPPLPTKGPALSDKSEIKVIVCEYLLRDQIRATSNTVLFVSLSDDELRGLRARFVGYDIRSSSRAEYVKRGQFRDKLTKESGLIVAVGDVEIHGNQADVIGGYFTGAGITFQFKLLKGKEWGIQQANGPIIADYFNLGYRSPGLALAICRCTKK